MVGGAEARCHRRSLHALLERSVSQRASRSAAILRGGDLLPRHAATARVLCGGGLDGGGPASCASSTSGFVSVAGPRARRRRRSRHKGVAMGFAPRDAWKMKARDGLGSLTLGSEDAPGRLDRGPPQNTHLVRCDQSLLCTGLPLWWTHVNGVTWVALGLVPRHTLIRCDGASGYVLGLAPCSHSGALNTLPTIDYGSPLSTVDRSARSQGSGPPATRVPTLVGDGGEPASFSWSYACTICHVPSPRSGIRASWVLASSALLAGAREWAAAIVFRRWGRLEWLPPCAVRLGALPSLRCSSRAVAGFGGRAADSGGRRGDCSTVALRVRGGMGDEDSALASPPPALLACCLPPHPLSAHALREASSSSIALSPPHSSCSLPAS